MVRAYNLPSVKVRVHKWAMSSHPHMSSSSLLLHPAFIFFSSFLASAALWQCWLSFYSFDPLSYIPLGQGSTALCRLRPCFNHSQATPAAHDRSTWGRGIQIPLQLLHSLRAAARVHTTPWRLPSKNGCIDSKKGIGYRQREPSRGFGGVIGQGSISTACGERNGMKGNRDESEREAVMHMQQRTSVYIS